eukprot:SAG31_NODE_136_length_23089_cov_8.825924_11_plen_117_part_00
MRGTLQYRLIPGTFRYQPTAAAGLEGFDASDSDENLTSDANEEPPNKQSKQADTMSDQVKSILPKSKMPKKQEAKYISYGVTLQGGVATKKDGTECAVPGWLQQYLKNLQKSLYIL